MDAIQAHATLYRKMGIEVLVAISRCFISSGVGRKRHPTPTSIMSTVVYETVLNPGEGKKKTGHMVITAL